MGGTLAGRTFGSTSTSVWGYGRRMVPTRFHPAGEMMFSLNIVGVGALLAISVRPKLLFGLTNQGARH